MHNEYFLVFQLLNVANVKAYKCLQPVSCCDYYYNIQILSLSQYSSGQNTKPKYNLILLIQYIPGISIIHFIHVGAE